MKPEQACCFFIVFILSLMAGTAPSGLAQKTTEAGSIEDIKQESNELFQALKDYTAKQREKAARLAKETLSSLDRRIDELEGRIDSKWDEMSKTARERARASLKALRRQRTRVAEWYGSLKSSSDAAWEEMKQGFADAYQALYDAWQKSEEELGAEDKSQ